MAMTVVTVPLGLAATVPAFADQRERADTESAAAHETLVALAGELAG